MLRENITAILARNETWEGHAATEPYEAGWAVEAIVFIRALKHPVGPQPTGRVQISADGMTWADEGTVVDLPRAEGDLRFAKLRHFGNWIRIATDFPDGSRSCLLVTIHLKG
jgi:hypothetical protein